MISQRPPALVPIFLHGKYFAEVCMDYLAIGSYTSFVSAKALTRDQELLKSCPLYCPAFRLTIPSNFCKAFILQIGKSKVFLYFQVGSCSLGLLMWWRQLSWVGLSLEGMSLQESLLKTFPELCPPGKPSSFLSRPIYPRKCFSAF